MVSLFDDQAAGLRRLFSAAHGPTSVAFAGPAGVQGALVRNVLVADLARGLAAAGKEVLILDEHAGTDSMAAAFGLRSRYDLLQALNRDVPANKVLLQVETAIRLLPAARAARQFARLDDMERRALGEWLRRLQKGVDFALVNAADRVEADFSPLLPQPQRIVIAVSADAPSITAAYALMKRLALRRGCRDYGIVVMRADSLSGGEALFVNLAEVARRHLGAKLELLAVMTPSGTPSDIGHPLVDAFLNPSCDSPEGGFKDTGKGMRCRPHGKFLEGAPQEYFLERSKPRLRGASAG